MRETYFSLHQSRSNHTPSSLHQGSVFHILYFSLPKLSREKQKCRTGSAALNCPECGWEGRFILVCGHVSNAKFNNDFRVHEADASLKYKWCWVLAFFANSDYCYLTHEENLGNFVGFWCVAGRILFKFEQGPPFFDRLSENLQHKLFCVVAKLHLKVKHGNPEHVAEVLPDVWGPGVFAWFTQESLCMRGMEMKRRKSGSGKVCFGRREGGWGWEGVGRRERSLPK